MIELIGFEKENYRNKGKCTECGAIFWYHDSDLKYKWFLAAYKSLRCPCCGKDIIPKRLPPGKTPLPAGSKKM